MVRQLDSFGKYKQYNVDNFTWLYKKGNIFALKVVNNGRVVEVIYQEKLNIQIYLIIKLPEFKVNKKKYAYFFFAIIFCD